MTRASVIFFVMLALGAWGLLMQHQAARGRSSRYGLYAHCLLFLTFLGVALTAVGFRPGSPSGLHLGAVNATWLFVAGLLIQSVWLVITRLRSKPFDLPQQSQQALPEDLTNA